MDQGYDVPIVLYGRSGWDGGQLWLELVIELRNGAISDVRLGRDNAILARPFSTLAAGVAIAQEIHDQRDGSMLIGTWRDENSVFTYSADGRFRCVWDTGDSAEGVWTVKSDVLTWRYANGNVTQYAVEYIGENEHRTRSASDGVVWTARRVRY
jgi:hypothetical protein